MIRVQHHNGEGQDDYMEASLGPDELLLVRGTSKSSVL